MRAFATLGLTAAMGMGLALSACGGAPGTTGDGVAEPTIGTSAVGSQSADPAVRFQLIDANRPGAGPVQQIIGDEHPQAVLDGAG